MTDPLEQQGTLEPENADARQNSASKKSCLKHRVLRDISNRQQGLEEPKKTKQVNFVVEKPDRPSTLTKNRSRRLPTRATMQAPANKEVQPSDKEEERLARMISIIDGLGDVNRAAFFGALHAMSGREPILATFQPGVTREFLDYFWSIKWSEQELTEDEKDDYEEFRKFEVKFLAGAAQLPELPPTEPTFIILFNPPANHPYLTTLIAHFCEYDSPHRLMIVGDLSLMLDLSSQLIWRSISLLYCLVTMHDRSRSALFTGLTSHHLGQSAGIPSLTLNLLRNQKPDGDDPVFFWNIKPNDRRVRILAMKMFLLHDTRAPITVDWMYNGLNMIDIAHSCGCLVVEDRGLETPESSLVALESSAQKEYSGKRVFWPDALSTSFSDDHSAYIRDLQPKSTEVGWLLLEQITAQNMAKHHTEAAQTFGQRFTFLTASFVADIKHEVLDKYIVMPQVSAKAMNIPSARMTLDEFQTRKRITRKDFWKFTKNVLPPNQPFVCRDKGSTPDWMVKLVDGDKQHLLCIQLKSGTTEYSIDKVIDELALSPGVTLVDKVSHYEGSNEDIKLTFVYGAMSHKKIKKCLRGQNNKQLSTGSSGNFGALRVTHESYPTKIPQNVEVIILLRTGLINLVGESNYNFIEEFDADTVHPNRVSKALNASFSKHHSAVATINTDARLKVPKNDTSLEAPVNDASPSHLMSDTFLDLSPIHSQGKDKEPGSESTAMASVESTLQRGTVRPREDDEETGAERAAKKQKKDEDTTAPIAGYLSMISNQEKTAESAMDEQR